MKFKRFYENSVFVICIGRKFVMRIRNNTSSLRIATHLLTYSEVKVSYAAMVTYIRNITVSRSICWNNTTGSSRNKSTTVDSYVPSNLFGHLQTELTPPHLLMQPNIDTI
jgi:hypothetical protein